MKKRGHITISFLALALTLPVTENLAQQRVQFTQYMFNGLVINPAYAGADQALSLTFIQRSQWGGIENAPNTQTLSGHTLFKKKHTGIGLTLINDKIGVHRNLNATATYAYHLNVGTDTYFSFGIQGGIQNRRSDYASIMGNTTTDPKLFNPVISSTSVDFGAGVYFRNRKFHLGVSAPQLIPERVSVNDTLSIKISKANYFVFAKYRIAVSENIDGEPSLLVKYLPGVPVSFDVNMNFIIKKVLTLGMSYRKRESIDFLMKGQITPQLQFGYAYDHPIGEISRLSSGSHEVMINYVFRYLQSNVTSPR